MRLFLLKKKLKIKGILCIVRFAWKRLVFEFTTKPDEGKKTELLQISRSSVLFVLCCPKNGRMNNIDQVFNFFRKQNKNTV